MVREAFAKMIRRNDTLRTAQYEVQKQDRPARLWVSELGRCKRKPFLRLSGVKETHPFDDYVLELFNSGHIWEREIIAAFPDSALRPVSTQMEVRSAVWSGKLDLVVWENEFPTIIEIKDTADHNFRARSRLPYPAHTLQLLAYVKLLRQKSDLSRDPKNILYYHGRGSWAEMTLTQHEEGIMFDGQKNYKDIGGVLPLNVDEEMGAFEGLWDAYQETGEIPERPYLSPFEERFSCCKVVRSMHFPACTFCGACWPKLNNPGPFDADEWGGEWETP